MHPSKLIEQARQTVAIADEAQRQTLTTVTLILDRQLIRPQTCKRPSHKPLTPKEITHNEAITQARLALEDEFGVDKVGIPF